MNGLWVVAYDIKDDRSRRRVSKILEDYGERVQFSVFECWLDNQTQSSLRQQMSVEIETNDSIRWYPLCVWCRREIYWQGAGKPAEDAGYYLL